MEKITVAASPDAPDSVPFSEMESGMLAGLWHVPIAGFGWTDAYRPFGTNGRLEVDSKPSDPGPWLVAQGAEARRYPLLRRSGLITAVERLAEAPTQERILAFADQWGSLGVERHLIPAQRLADGSLTIVAGTMASGESLADWRTRLFAFADLRNLWRAVSLCRNADSWSPGQVREARRYLAERIRWSAGGGCTYHSRFDALGFWSEWHQSIYDPRDLEAASLKTHLDGESTIDAGRLHVYRRVNAEMRGSVSPAVLPHLDGAMRFFPASLIAAVWLQFAQELAGKAGRERECEHCRLPFPQRRRDQRFCGKNCQEASAYMRRRAKPT